MTFSRNALALALVASMVFTAHAAEQPVKAGIVPGADVLLRIDAAGMIQSPIYQFLDTQFGSDDAEASQVEQLMATHLGISEDDIIAAIGSINSATLLELEQGQTPKWETLPVSVALLFRKPVGIAKLVAFLDAVNTEVEPGEYEKAQVAGRDAVKILSDTTNEPPLYITFSPDGMAAYLALSDTALDAAVRRAIGQQAVALSPQLAALRGQVPAGAQMKLLYRAPQRLRDKISEAAAAAASPNGARGGMNPAAGMMGGMVKMLEGLQSVGLGFSFTDAFGLHLSGDLGGAPQAQQAAMMLKNMLVPMLQMQLAGMTPPGEQPIDATKLIAVGSAGNMLNIGIRVDQALITKIQEMQKAAMQGAMQDDVQGMPGGMDSEPMPGRMPPGM